MTPLFRRVRRLLPMRVHVGYGSHHIAERVRQKTAVYRPAERLGLAVRTVLDFGGGCGAHWRQFIGPEKWAVVETPIMVLHGRSIVRPEDVRRLRFFTDIHAAADWLGDVDMVYSNGALQYCENPYLMLARLCGLGARRMLWERTEVVEGPTQPYVQRSWLSDHGPGEPMGSEAEVRTPVRPVRLAPFLNAHWDYELDRPDSAEYQRWSFRRR